MPLAWLWFELDIQVMRLYVTWNWHLYTCNRCKLNAIYFHALSLSLCVCPSLSLSMSAAFDEINKVDAQPCHRFQWSVFKKRSPATGNGNRATCWKRAVRWVEMSIWKVVFQRTFPRIQTDLHCPLLRCKGITTVLCVSIPFLLFLGKCCPVSSPTT